jgi:hypothetical protein
LPGQAIRPDDELHFVAEMWCAPDVLVERPREKAGLLHGNPASSPIIYVAAV